MNHLFFPLEEVVELARHANLSPEHRESYVPELEFENAAKEPALWLVGDQGVYLMSNGRDTRSHKLGPGVVYAKGVNPKTDADWWENKYATFGGDDGVEVLPICDAVIQHYEVGFTTLAIDLSESEIGIQFMRNKTRGVA